MIFRGDLHFSLYIIGVLLLFSCEKEGVPSFDIQGNDQYNENPITIVFTKANYVQRKYDFAYDSNHQLKELTETTYSSEVKTYKCTYAYENNQLIKKIWQGAIDKGIHGNNIAANTQYAYSYINSEIHEVRKEDTFDPKEIETSYLFDQSLNFITKNNNTSSVDTTFLKQGENNWTDVYSNLLYKQTYQFTEQKELTVKNHVGVERLTAQLSQVKSVLLPEVELLLFHFLTNTNTQSNSYLRGNSAVYFSPIKHALFSNLPLVVNGINYAYNLDPLQRINTITSSAGLKIQFSYQKSE